MVSVKKILSCFSLKAYVKHVTPDGVIIGPKRIIWTNLVEVHLGDATYQISKL